MARDTKIEWCDHTFNPWVGCTKVSPACDHCYAEGWAKRAGKPELWHGERRRTSAANWRQPIKWDTAAAAEGKRAKVFCASLADVFDNQADPEWRADLWRLIEVCQNLDWLLLTKRPQNIAKMLPSNWGEGYPNVWLGTTVENQAEADRRIIHLLKVPAKVRFLSCEPLLGPVDLENLDCWEVKGCERLDVLSGIGKGILGEPVRGIPRVHWVIAGGESGGNARPSHPDWIRSLRDQCYVADVPFHFKQWGEWKPLGWEHAGSKTLITAAGAVIGKALAESNRDVPGQGLVEIARAGKKRAGRLLDGFEHNGAPA